MRNDAKGASIIASSEARTELGKLLFRWSAETIFTKIYEEKGFRTPSL